MRPLFFLLPSLVLFGVSCQRTDRGSSVPTASSTTQPATPAAALRETRWVLRQVAGQPIAALSANSQEPFLRITEAGTAQGHGSCNTFRGPLQPATNDGDLQFGPLMSTRMACPALATEQQFTKALVDTRSYRISGDTLLLYSSTERSGTPLARLEAVRMQ